MRSYGEQSVEKSAVTIRASTQNRLQSRKEQLEKELKAVNEAIELFGKHPEIADAMDLLSQIGI